METHILNGLIIGGSYVLIALGLTLIFGILVRHGSCARGSLHAGGFALYYLFGAGGLNYWAALVLAVGAVAVLGIFIEKLAFRPLRKQPL